jgi:hypothetical protein
MKYFVSLLAVIALLSCSDEIKGLTVCDGAVLDDSRQVTFSQTAWNDGGPSERGQMVVDLAERHQLTDVSPNVVRDLLGPNTCYVNYDDEPCYVLSLAGKRQYLAFPVAHSGAERGKVIAAYLRSDASSLTGCPYK